MQYSSSLFTAPYVVLYVTTTTAAGKQISCIQHRYFYISRISGTYVSLYFKSFTGTSGNYEQSGLNF